MWMSQAESVVAVVFRLININLLKIALDYAGFAAANYAGMCPKGVDAPGTKDEVFFRPR